MMMWADVAATATVAFGIVALVHASAAVDSPLARPPVDVFVSGTEGYPCYRIPAVLRLPSGTILVFAEGRRGGDTGPNDIVYKASVDQGATWSALHVLHSEWEPPGHGWHTLKKNATWNTTHAWAEQDGFFAGGHDWIPPANVTFAAAQASWRCHRRVGVLGSQYMTKACGLLPGHGCGRHRLATPLP